MYVYWSKFNYCTWIFHPIWLWFIRYTFICGNCLAFFFKKIYWFWKYTVPLVSVWCRQQEVRLSVYAITATWVHVLKMAGGMVPSFNFMLWNILYRVFNDLSIFLFLLLNYFINVIKFLEEIKVVRNVYVKNLARLFLK